jgi:hypothetical protein
MTAAHVCDECKTVAPLDEAIGWWHVEAMGSHGVQVLTMAEKTEYQFCSWACLTKTGARLASLRGAS